MREELARSCAVNSMSSLLSGDCTHLPTESLERRASVWPFTEGLTFFLWREDVLPGSLIPRGEMASYFCTTVRKLASVLK